MSYSMAGCRSHRAARMITAGECQMLRKIIGYSVSLLLFCLSPSIATAGLVHRWTFSSGPADSIGGATATLVNGATISGGALVLDGVDDHASLPIGQTIGQLTNATIEAWVIWDNNATYWSRIFDFSNSTLVNMFLTPRNGRLDEGPTVGTPRFGIRVAELPAEQQVNSAALFPVGALTHVAVSIDSVQGIGRLYMNGALVATRTGLTLSPAMLGVTAHNFLGRSTYGQDPYFDGSIAEFRIYDHRLSEEAVAASYQAGADSLGNCPTGVSAPDADGDGIPDLCDTCIAVANPDQTDSDNDGFGNRCDADLNNSGLVTTSDYAILRSRLNTNDPNADLNNSGTVTTADYAILRSLLNQTPGPSGLRENPNSFLSTPAAGYSRLIPVVIINFVPTIDGQHINEALWTGRPWGLPVEWGNTNAISDVMNYIRDSYSRRKFMVEEGSRYHGYKDPGAPPYLGYQVVAIHNFYRPIILDEAYPGTTDSFLPDMQDVMARIPARYYVEQRGVKEFWLSNYETWGSRNLVVPESNMASPTTGDISNSYRHADDLPIFASTYTVMGLDYFRTSNESVHAFGHQAEAILSHAAWLQDGNSDLFWERFAGFDTSAPSDWVWGTGHCGSVHYPLNAEHDYDYWNARTVQSDCEDWRPDGTGPTKDVSVSTWRDHLYPWPSEFAPPLDWRSEAHWYIYWMQNFPGANNQIPYQNTTMENWWRFVSDWDAAIQAGDGLHR